jgi:endonuclease VIII
MPEGPEIRREALAIAEAIVERPLVRIEYRVPRLVRRARTLRGASVTSVSSRGKAMLIAYSNGLTHYSHNQLYGTWRVLAVARLARLLEQRQPSIRVVLQTATHAAVLLSATQIELLTRAELARQPYLAKLGPDVLDRSTTVRTVQARLRKPEFAGRSLGALLLDQAFLAGLGNYLRSDILHVTGLRHSVRPVDLSDAAITALARATLELPRLSLKTGGATNDPALARRLAREGVTPGARRFRAYAREAQPCWTCGTRIERIDVGGRGIYFCSTCQPATGVQEKRVRKNAAARTRRSV